MLDEWSLIGGIKLEGTQFILNQHNILDRFSGLHHPLALLVVNNLYRIFNFSTLPFIYIGIFLHILTCLSVYYLAKILTKNNFIAIIAGLFFSSSFAYAQVLNWVATFIEVPGSTLFMSLSIISIFNYINSRRIFLAFLSLICAYISFLFWDAFIFLFISLSIILFFNETKKNKSTWFYLFTLFITMIFIILRIISFKSAGKVEDLPVVMGITSLFEGKAGYILWVKNSVIYPLTAVAQSFFPMRLLTKIYELRILSVVAEIINIRIFIYLISIVLSFFIFFFSCKLTQYRKIILMLLILFVMGFVPVALYFKQINIPYVDERYLYYPLVFLSVLFGIFVYSFIKVSFKKVSLRNKSLLIFLLLLIYFYKNASTADSLMNSALDPQREIRTVVQQLLNYKEYIPEKPIFFVSSNREYYYYSNHKLPFLHGVGYMLFIIFLEENKYPKKLLTERYLQGMSSQGYKEINGGGFGYFYDKSKLLELYKSNNKLDTSQIIAFVYDDRNKKITLNSNDLQVFISTSSGRVK